MSCPEDDVIPCGSGQDLINLIITAVFSEQVIVDCKGSGNPLILQVLRDQCLIDLQIMFFIQLHHLRQIDPAARGHELFAIHGGLDLVEVFLSRIQIRQHCRMNADRMRILLPRLIVRFHIDALQTIPGGDIEIPDRLVIFRRIPGGHDNPAGWKMMLAEYLVLQKLQHRRS